MRPACHCGFTLAEVLVALFVLAVGVLGAAAAQNMAARTRHDSALHASALQLAQSLAEAIAANPAQLALPDSDKVALQDAGPPWLCTGGCSPAQLAATERDETAAAVARALPGGRLRVCRDAAAGPLAWECAPGPTGADSALVVKIGWRAHAVDTFISVLVAEAL